MRSRNNDKTDSPSATEKCGLFAVKKSSSHKSQKLKKKQFFGIQNGKNGTLLTTIK